MLGGKLGKERFLLAWREVVDAFDRGDDVVARKGDREEIGDLKPRILDACRSRALDRDVADVYSGDRRSGAEDRPGKVTLAAAKL